MIDDLKAFVAVVQERSLTKAATRLCLTQSAISRRIQQLEATLDGALLDRNSRPPVPTLLGRRVYTQALCVIDEVQALLMLPQEGAEPIGTLRLGVAYALTESLSLPIVQALATSYSKLEVRLTTAWSAALQDLVSAHELDAAVALLDKSTAPSASSRGRKVGEIEVVIVQSRRHPLVRKKASMADLASLNWVLNPLGCSYRAELERALGASGKQLRVAVDTHGAELQLNMVASGIGLGIAPPILLKTSSFRKQIQVVDVADFRLQLDVWTMHAKQLGNMSQAIGLMSDIVETAVLK